MSPESYKMKPSYVSRKIFRHNQVDLPWNHQDVTMSPVHMENTVQIDSEKHTVKIRIYQRYENYPVFDGKV